MAQQASDQLEDAREAIGSLAAAIDAIAISAARAVVALPFGLPEDIATAQRAASDARDLLEGFDRSNDEDLDLGEDDQDDATA